jgi:hypothetical protein
MDPFAAKMTESDKESIKFNGHHYDSWKGQDMHILGSAGSVWSIVKLVNKDPQDLVGPFELRCRHCNQTCQLGNPSKWFKQHSGSCKGSNSAPDSTQVILAVNVTKLQCLPPTKSPPWVTSGPARRWPPLQCARLCGRSTWLSVSSPIRCGLSAAQSASHQCRN